MSYEFYKILHLIGLVLLFSGLVSLLTLRVVGAEVNGPAKKFAFLTHGIGLFLILLSGFGLLARLGLVRELPGWIYVKLVIWLYFGLTIALIKRKGQLGWIMYLPMLVIFILAAYLGVNKTSF